MPIIPVDSELGKTFGFTSDKFECASYLWSDDNTIYVSFIMAKDFHKGHFRELVNTILKKGYIVKIPTPIGIMPHIVRKWKFEKTYEFDEHLKTNIDILKEYIDNVFERKKKLGRQILSYSLYCFNSIIVDL